MVAREVVSIAVNEVEEAASAAPLQHYHQICTFNEKKKIFFKNIIYTGAHERPYYIKALFSLYSGSVGSIKALLRRY